MLLQPGQRVGLKQLPGRLPEQIQNLIWKAVSVTDTRVTSVKWSRGEVVENPLCLEAIDVLRALLPSLQGR